MINDVIVGDCLDVMKSIPDRSIDMVLCDLPYGTTKCKWDTPINLTSLWEQYNRIIKDNGPVLLFAQTPFDKILGASNISILRYEWIWEKGQATGHFNAHKAPMKAHENILVFYKNPPIYNPQMSTGHKPMNSFTKRADVVNKTTVYGKVKLDISGGGSTDRFPRSVLKFSSDKQINKSKGVLHPTQKPVALCEYLIRTYTNEGDLVLDNCAGSGTTGVACKNTGRNFILIEKEQIFADICATRLL